MNTKKIIQCLVKIGLHMTLIGSRVKLWAALSFGWESEKPIALQKKSAGNAGFVMFLVPVLLKLTPIVHKALLLTIQIVHQARERADRLLHCFD